MTRAIRPFLHEDEGLIPELIMQVSLILTLAIVLDRIHLR